MIPVWLWEIIQILLLPFILHNLKWYLTLTYPTVKRAKKMNIITIWTITEKYNTIAEHEFTILFFSDINNRTLDNEYFYHNTCCWRYRLCVSSASAVVVFNSFKISENVSINLHLNLSTNLTKCRINCRVMLGNCSQ